MVGGGAGEGTRRAADGLLLTWWVENVGIQVPLVPRDSASRPAGIAGEVTVPKDAASAGTQVASRGDEVACQSATRLQHCTVESYE